MSRIFQPIAWGLVVLTVCLSSQQAEAQRFGVVIGNGGGVRIGVGNGPMYGPGYYGPGGAGYRNYGYGPVGVGVAARPAYVAPTQPLAAPGQLVAPQSPTLMTPTPLLVDGGEIVLFNPSSTGQDVRYLLNGQLFTMPSGTKQSIVNDRTWTIQYEASPGTISTYTLVTARYKFKPTEAGGVGLFQTQDTPEAAQAAGLGLPTAPTPDPPEGPIPQPPLPDLDGTVIPSRPALKTTP